MSESRQKDHFQKPKTEAAGKLWERLREGHAGHKFRHQVSVGPYLADFMTLPLKLIVEIDNAHNANRRNEAREKVLKTLGYEVVHLQETDVLDNIEGALKEISTAVAKRTKK